jgi:tetratricopeptide (TPR) repeat protein
MARVFLSYDRADAHKARAIALALERAGHFVWWDLHIKGGAEYGKVIEEALAAADAVVVLWSAQSIESAWVRDEAAAGRDRGRLVPVRLDDANPPLGFRQYQNIDLSAWTGRRRPVLNAILAAIDSVSGSQQGESWSHQGPAEPAVKGRRPPRLLALAALAIIVATAAALIFWQPWRAQHEAPSVAVVPAERSDTATSLAADLLIKLGVLQSSHADALQLVDLEARQAPDFIIKVGSANAGKGAAANLMLVDNRTDTLLWSREFTEPRGNQADLRQQMAYSAAQVLDCAVQGLESTEQKIKLPTLKLYLSGCADMSHLLAQDPKVAASIFTRVIAQAPSFRGGWKKLGIAKMQTLRAGFGVDPSARHDLQTYVNQVQRVDPGLGEAFLAQAWLVPPRQITRFMKLVDQAVAADPENPNILAFQAIALTNVGRMQDALAAARRAVESNPLSPSARDALIIALLNSDQVEAARNELQESEQLWPGATNVLQSRFAVEFRTGDPRRALKIMQSGQLGAGYVSNAAHESYLRAKIEPNPQNKEAAVASARALSLKDPTASWIYARALAEFDRHENLVDFLLATDARLPYTITWVIFRSSFASLHNDPRFMAIAKRLGVSNFWRDTGKWPDFCTRSDLPYDCKAEAAKLG